MVPQPCIESGIRPRARRDVSPRDSRSRRLPMYTWSCLSRQPCHRPHARWCVRGACAMVCEGWRCPSDRSRALSALKVPLQMCCGCRLGTLRRQGHFPSSLLRSIKIELAALYQCQSQSFVSAGSCARARPGVPALGRLAPLRCCSVGRWSPRVPYARLPAADAAPAMPAESTAPSAAPESVS